MNISLQHHNNTILYTYSEYLKHCKSLTRTHTIYYIWTVCCLFYTLTPPPAGWWGGCCCFGCCWCVDKWWAHWQCVLHTLLGWRFAFIYINTVIRRRAHINTDAVHKPTTTHKTLASRIYICNIAHICVSWRLYIRSNTLTIIYRFIVKELWQIYWRALIVVVGSFCHQERTQDVFLYKLK